MANTINLTLKVWRQKSSDSPGAFEIYQAHDIDTDLSFLEMLDVVNINLEKNGKEPIAFDHDCREGICGCCGAVINGQAHGPEHGTTLCQLHVRKFRDGDTLVIEPWRSRAFPVVRDLIVDRSAFDRIIQAGGYVTVRTGSAPEAHSLPVPKIDADEAFDSAACIGCGACVAACPNASAVLFVGAKISHLALLPQGRVERERRARAMVERMDLEGFGNCSNHYECEAACPKEISVRNIARLNREFFRAFVKG
ncbi:MAG: succinate dehydrogenase [Candidatus Hinthialibacteria bacterium]|nr:succinate dehydrogenase/fumarate reductase iron-sulfur subunit [bacterium]MBK7496204.1 succinate dehydrogenase/fumarate reductase iron-sulfur subunit [Candidatus Omnitrophota bacterium]MBV6481595.1 Fumarate reductase iron-sulfur subunit [bacterium]MCE7909435.1 succinate dehydrogenase/fumarate reductase iron-sulfur subunit [Candidatus Omnitrophica bacterium COP1]